MGILNLRIMGKILGNSGKIIGNFKNIIGASLITINKLTIAN